MPYIPKERREALFNADAPEFEAAGELNFIFTELIKLYINQKGMSYNTCNEIIGVLDAAKLEFYRRVVAPYEDQKIKENGDVYEIK